MSDKGTAQQVQRLLEQWEILLQTNKLNICTEALAGATVLEVNILKAAEKNPDIILREITKLFGVPSSTLTSAVNRLEKRNLIKRVISQRDLRSFGLSITEEGKSALADHYKKEEKLIRTMMQSFDTREECNEFIRLFEKLVTYVSELEP